MGAKHIFHLEAFVAKYMRLYERYVKIGDINNLRMRLTLIAAIPWAWTSIPHNRWGNITGKDYQDK